MERKGTERMDETGARRIARWLLVAFYGVAGVAHLIVTDAMVKIMPAWVPDAHLVVMLTGVCELAGAAGLASGRYRHRAGWALAAYAVCVYPANIQHAINDLRTGTGLGWEYHGPRLALQPFIVWWALWSSGAFGVSRRR